jgi:hypothetical protein
MSRTARLPILLQNMSPTGGDASLTIPVCKASCYRRAYCFVGVQEGNQCWCGSYVDGEWANNQNDYKTPCTGDKKTFCRAKGLVNVFNAQENQPPLPSTGTNTSASTGVKSVNVSQTGAAVNMVMLCCV